MAKTGATDVERFFHTHGTEWMGSFQNLVRDEVMRGIAQIELVRMKIKDDKSPVTRADFIGLLEGLASNERKWTWKDLFDDFEEDSVEEKIGFVGIKALWDPNAKMAQLKQKQVKQEAKLKAQQEKLQAKQELMAQKQATMAGTMAADLESQPAEEPVVAEVPGEKTTSERLVAGGTDALLKGFGF